MERERERGRYRDRERQTDRQTDRQRRGVKTRKRGRGNRVQAIINEIIK